MPDPAPKWFYHKVGSSAGRLFQLKYFAPACGPADR
jgi:hypothetical protein